MHPLLRLVSATVLCAAPLTALAISSDVYITNVVFSDDHDTATIYLSQSIPYGTVRYDLSVDDVVRRVGGTSADGKTVVTLSGFRDDFLLEGGRGTYEVAFQICQHGADRLNTTVDCSSPAIATVRFGGEDSPYKFGDVPPFHANADAIAYVQAEGIVEGYADGTFRPDQTINRAEFTKIVIGSNFTDQALELCDGFGFPDASRTAWYAPYVCLAAQHRIIEGYPDGTFRPDASINFVEAAKIIATVDNFFVNGVRYDNTPSQYGILGPPLPESVDGYWYEPYVRYLADRNAIPMTIAHLDQRITRGEMAEMIYRLLSDNDDKPSRTYEEFGGSASTKRYSNRTFSVEYPADWRVDEDAETVDGHEGVAFRPSDGHDEWDYVLLSIESTCPDLTHLQPTSTPDDPDTMVFNGSSFDVNDWSEGAAGSSWRGKVYVYAYPVGAGCFVARTSIYSSPGSYDADADRWRDEARMNALEDAYEEILDTIVFYLG